MSAGAFKLRSACVLTAFLWMAGALMTARMGAAQAPLPRGAFGAGAAQGRPPAEGMQGPWNNDILVHRISPGGEAEKLAVFERAGVSTLARLHDGRLIAAHQHFPENDDANFDKVAVRFSTDEGETWSPPRVIGLTSLPEGMRFPFDPTLTPLPDGRVRLYFTSMQGRRFDESAPAIYSAVSVDGVDYVFEPGVRFEVEGRIVIDCAVALHQGVFHLFAPDNGAALQPGRDPAAQTGADRPRIGTGYHAISEDGLNFTRAEDIYLDGPFRWLGNAQSDGKTITFFGTGNPNEPGRPRAEPPRGGIWMATSPDGQSWELLTSLPIPGADPGAVQAAGGGWIVTSTDPPRQRGSLPEE